MISSPEQQAVDAAITTRRSIRAFLPTPVARAEIAQILRVAGRAPSGTNTQPWKVYVLDGERKRQLSAAILAAHHDPQQAQQHQEEYAYYPREWVSPYIERRRKVGWDLYALLGLTRDNKAGMAAQHGKNYDFFGAPVGLIFTIDRVMEQGSWLDYGMFLQSIMVAARARGLDTCPQAAFTQYHRIRPTNWPCRTRKWWCAAWRWAWPIRTRLRMRCTPSVWRSRNLLNLSILTSLLLPYCAHTTNDAANVKSSCAGSAFCYTATGLIEFFWGYEWLKSH